MKQGGLLVGRHIRFFSAFEWMIALRYLLPDRKHIFTSIITIISFVGILIGVWALIVVMSVMNGFRTELLDRILGVNGHIIIHPLESGFENYDAFYPALEKISEIVFSLPVVEGQVLAQSGDGEATGALVRGIREQDLQKVTLVQKNIKYGSLKGFDQSGGVAIGVGMAKRLGLSIGDNLRIISPEGDVTPFGVMPRIKVYEVFALYEIGMYDYDSSVIFMPLSEAELFFNLDGKIQYIEIFLNNPDKIESVRTSLENSFGHKVYMIDWRERNQAFFSTLQIEHNVMFMILSLIIIVAALNIISGLVILVRDKVHDIAVLRTMGACRGTIMRIFILVGVTVGASGTFFGLVLGIMTCWKLDEIQTFVSWLSGVNVFNPEFYFLSHLPTKIDIRQITTVVLMALFLSFFSALFPAWKASRLDPVQAMRYE